MLTTVTRINTNIRPRLDVTPLTEDDVVEAASLLAARHDADRTRDPRLPSAFADPSYALAALHELRKRPEIRGVAVRSGRRLVGYLLGGPDCVEPTSWGSPFARPDAADVTYVGHAVAAEREDEASDIYRTLYAALAGGWATAQLFSHYVALPARDGRALAAWSALGFGQAMTLATRRTDSAPAPSRDPGIEIRRATPVDAPVVNALAEGLFQSLAEPPTLLPVSPSILPDLRRQHAALLADPACPHWLAFRGRRPVGLHVVIEPHSPAWFLAPIVTPDRCTYLFEAYVVPEERGAGVGAALLDATFAWARTAGYAHCALHHLPGAFAAGYWRKRGFRPLEVRLCRRLDDRGEDASARWQRSAPGAPSAARRDRDLPLMPPRHPR